MTNILCRASLLFLTIAACHKSPSGAPCDPEAVKALAAQLAGKSATAGTQYAFTGCKFDGQGNDVVSFSDNAGGKSIDCKLKGGADAVTEFRRSAMKVGLAKLKLDVSGTITANGDRFELADCDVTAHD